MTHTDPMDRLWVVMDHALWSVHNAFVLAQEFRPEEPKKTISSSWMRVNYAGEVCAQALLLGAMCTAETDKNFDHFALLMREEMKHLIWCRQRLFDIASPCPSFLALWASVAFMLALVNGMRGDALSWALIEETEVLVMRHLRESYRVLLDMDTESAIIVAKILEDEIAHAATAHTALPLRIRTGIMPMMQPLFSILKQVEM